LRAEVYSGGGRDGGSHSARERASLLGDYLIIIILQWTVRDKGVYVIPVADRQTGQLRESGTNKNVISAASTIPEASFL
jgi:hypothetical protein